MASVLFVTDNEAGGNAGREIVIVIRPLNGTEEAKRACEVLGHTIIDALGDYNSGNALLNYAGRVEEFAQPANRWPSAQE